MESPDRFYRKKVAQPRLEERLTIASMYVQGSSMRAMARMLGRSGNREP
jgi:hypothetical protein